MSTSEATAVKAPEKDKKEIRRPRSSFGRTFGRRLIERYPWLLLAALLVILVALPIIPLQARAFADNFAGFRSMTEMTDLGPILIRTLILGVGALIIAMVLGTLLALSMHVMSARARRYLGFMPVLPMVIPSVAHVVGFVFLLSPENGYLNAMLRALPFIDDTQPGPINVYTEFGVVLYTGIHLTAFVYMFVYNGLRNLGQGYNLAAKVSGAGALRTLFTVTLPMLRPVLVYAGTVCFLLSLGQFTAPLLLGRREGVTVLMTRMFDLTFEYPLNFGLIAAMGTPLVIMAIALVVVQRRLIGNQDRFVGQVDMADSASQSPVIRTLAMAFVVTFTFFGAILPLLALVFVSLSPFWSSTLSFDNLSLAAFDTVFSDRKFVASIGTSLTVSALAVLLVIPLGLMIAVGIYNRDRLWWPVPPVLDFIANIPLGVPAALMGFGYLFALAGPVHLTGTAAGFVLAYLTLMIPYSVRYSLATLISLGKQTVDASRVSGAGPLRTLLQITLPLARGGIASSAAIMFVLLIHEFGVSLLLRSAKVNVMSVVLFEQYDSGSYPQVAVMALTMTAITAAGLVAALAIGGRRALERL